MDYLIEFQGETLEVESPTLECLKECFKENQDYIEEVLADIPSRCMPNGYGIPYGRLDEAYDVINDKYGNCAVKVFEISEDGIKKYICDFSLATIYTQIFKEREESEQGMVDGAQLALDMMRNFLEDGHWHYGLISEDGIILENSDEWPSYPKQSDGSIRWIRDGKELSPIIWFGVDEQSPIECWTLYNRANIRNTKVYWGRNNTKIDQEHWKHFWFCEFWSMDWNVLWNNDEAAITWAFCECCMEEPVEDFYKVKSNCLIELVQGDSTDKMLAKVRDYCYYMQKKHILEKSIFKAGYDVGACFADLNKDGICLEDGRPNPVWLNDGFCDMVSEALYGDSQADDIEIDEKYFGQEEFEGPYSSNNHWNAIIRYVDDVEELFYGGWYKYLVEQYGEDWEQYKY